MPVSSPPRTTTNTERITKGSRAPLPPLPFLPSLLLLLPLLSILSYTSYTLHYTLPTPLPPHDPTTLAPQFSELEAMKYVQDLAVHSGDGAPRYRIVGTEEMVETERYLLGKVEGIKSLVESQGFGQEVEIEVWHQVRVFLGLVSLRFAEDFALTICNGSDLYIGGVGGTSLRSVRPFWALSLPPISLSSRTNPTYYTKQQTSWTN